MIYLLCVVRGQLDPVFSFKDEHKSAKEHAYTEMQVSALEKYTKSNNITKLLAEL